MESPKLSSEAKQCLKGVLTYLWMVHQYKYTRFANKTIFCAFSSMENFEKMAIEPLEDLISRRLIEGKTKDQVAEILDYFKSLIKNATHTAFHERLLENEMEQRIIRPLIKISGWNSKDEDEAKNLFNLLVEKSEGKTPRESSSKLWSAIKIGGSIATGAGVIWGIYAHLKKNKTGK